MNARRLIAFATTIILAATLWIPGIAWADDQGSNFATVTIGSIEVDNADLSQTDGPGPIVTIPIYFHGNCTIAASDISFTYDPTEIRVVGAHLAGLSLDNMLVDEEDGFVYDPLLMFEPLDEGLCRVTWSTSDYMYAAGLFYALEVQPLNVSPGHTSTITGSMGELGAFDYDFADIDFVFVAGGITVVENDLPPIPDNPPVPNEFQLTYVNADGGVILTSAMGKEPSLALPSHVDGVPLIGIGEDAFEAAPYLSEISIPATVATMGSGALANCPMLQTVTFQGANPYFYPDSVFGTRDASAPVAIRYPGDDGTWSSLSDSAGFVWVAYQEESDFEILYSVEEGHAKVIGIAGNAITLNIPSQYNGLPVTEVCDFNNRALIREIIFPNTLTALPSFWGTPNLESVFIPAGITEIPNDSFNNRQLLSNVTFAEGSNLEVIGGNAFHNCPNLSAINLPATVTTIDSGAFMNCISLQSISIPAATVSIGSGAFMGCASLSQVTIPENSQLGAIGSSAFQNCSALQAITIPSTVTSIGQTAFYGLANPSYLYVGSRAQYLQLAYNWTVLNPFETSVILTASLPLSEATITAPDSTRWNDGEGIINVTVTYDGSELIEGEDFTVSFQDNTTLGPAKCIITGINGYEGQVIVPFEVLSPNGYHLMDINMDRRINLADQVVLKWMLSGKYTLTVENRLLADANRNGIIDKEDQTILARA